jgi:tetratricopeptide (TPR) repeat protein
MTLEQILQVAVAHHKAGETQDAERLYRSILNEQVSHPDANHNLGIILKQGNQTEIALFFFKKALEASPNQSQFWVSYIDALIDSGRLDVAQSILDQGQSMGLKGDVVGQLVARLNLQSKITPSSIPVPLKLIEPEQLLARAKSYAKKGKGEEAAKLYNTILATYPQNQQAKKGLKSLRSAKILKNNWLDPPQNQIDLIFTLFTQGRIQEVLNAINVLIKNYPNSSVLYNIIAACYASIGRLDAAVKSYEQALTINPSYAEAHSNLGLTFHELGQFDAAIKSYEQALLINPDFAAAHNNLGLTFKELGQLDAAIKSYEQALAIKPDYADVWGNLYFAAKPLIFSEGLKGTWLTSFKKKLGRDVLAGADFAILDYQLNAYRPHTVETSFNCVVKALPAFGAEAINNPEGLKQLDDSVVILEQVIGLIHFGRSGTGLLHSLIDNHSEISTLPSIYFSEYFNATVWKHLTARGWAHLPERFVEQFAVLFDARSSMPVPSIQKPIVNVGRDEGMTSVGEGRDEFLVVDKQVFCSELQRLMRGYVVLGPKIFFDLVHVAYEKALKNNTPKHTIFYHIHNPSPYAKINFLRYHPDARLIMMVREPIQSCESWIKKVFNSKDKNNVHTRIITMLFAFDQIVFRVQDSIGVRLEDLKMEPKATMGALSDWMGIEDSPTLYEMTAQGKQWWGDPTSPDYGKEAMSPFGDSSIKRSVGSIFSEQDQFILRTLFYPFSVRFGYVAENIAGFKADLQAIKFLLNEPFDFERQLAELSDISIETFLKSGSSKYFRAGLHDRWEVLEECHDYPHMLKPLTISVKK